jgi:hypothetical protein
VVLQRAIHGHVEIGDPYSLVLYLDCQRPSIGLLLDIFYVFTETALSGKWNLLSGQGHEAFGQLDHFPWQVPGGRDG